MASNQPQRVRRNASPSTKQGPMKATMQFALRQGSPSRPNSKKGSPSSSPTPISILEPHRLKTRRSPDNRASPERRSPSSPSAFKVERPKPVRLSPANPVTIRRTGSLDTIAGPYLTGQWPRDVTSFYSSTYTNNFGQQVCDKTTQTPDEFYDSGSKKKQQQHKRSASLGNGDNLKELIKQRLQRTKEGSKQESIKQRQSPLHGNHSALGQTTQSTITTSVPIKIPVAHIPKQAAVPRIRGSVEGLNQEIEKLVLKNVSGLDDEESIRTQEQAPDGHRAPILELVGTRTVDTQTPAALGDDISRTPLGDDSNGRASSGSGGDRSQSISPSFPIIPGNMDTSRSSSRSDSSDSATKEPEIKVEKEEEDSISPADYPPFSKYAASPKPNKSFNFVRGPPDGCERVKTIDESSYKRPVLVELCPAPSHRVFKQSESSAFAPMSRYSLTDMMSRSNIVIKSPVTVAPTAGHAGIESQ